MTMYEQALIERIDDLKILLWEGLEFMKGTTKKEKQWLKRVREELYGDSNSVSRTV